MLVNNVNYPAFNAIQINSSNKYVRSVTSFLLFNMEDAILVKSSVAEHALHNKFVYNVSIKILLIYLMDNVSVKLTYRNQASLKEFVFNVKLQDVLLVIITN